MSVQFRNAADSSRQHLVHELAIEALVKETNVGVERVRELYEVEHARLSSQAKIKTYVSVFAARLVRTALHETRSVIQ